MPLFQKIFASIASSLRWGWPWSQIYETHQCTSKGHQKKQILNRKKNHHGYISNRKKKTSAFRMYCRSCCVVSVCPETFFILKTASVCMKLRCFTHTRKPQAWPWQKTKSRTLSLFYTSRWVRNLSQLRLRASEICNVDSQFFSGKLDFSGTLDVTQPTFSKFKNIDVHLAQKWLIMSTLDVDKSLCFTGSPSRSQNESKRGTPESTPAIWTWNLKKWFVQEKIFVGNHFGVHVMFQCCFSMCEAYPNYRKCFWLMERLFQHDKV